jgi:hypothetical protein
LIHTLTLIIFFNRESSYSRLLFNPRLSWQVFSSRKMFEE